MKKFLILVLMSISLTSCGKTKEELEAEAAKKAAVEAEQKAAAERAAFEERTRPYIEALKEVLKDPGSAQFRNLYFGYDKRFGNALCGEVNAKNSYGGYTGFSPFAVSDLPLNGGSRVVIKNSEGSSTDKLMNDLYFVQAGCSKKPQRDASPALGPASSGSSSTGK